MPTQEPSAEKPTSDERSAAAEPPDTAAERASVPAARKRQAGKVTPGADDAADAVETADKTDMGAVGDDGQVFGG